MTKEKWVIVFAAESPQAEQHQLTDSRVDANILTRVILHDDKDTLMVPLRKMVVPCFVAHNKEYTNTTNDNMHIDDRTAYIVESIAKWGDFFLPIHDV